MIEEHCSRGCVRASIVLGVAYCNNTGKASHFRLYTLKDSVRSAQTIASAGFVILPVDHRRNNNDWWLLFEQRFDAARISKIQSSRARRMQRVENDLLCHNHHQSTYVMLCHTRGNPEMLDG